MIIASRKITDTILIAGAAVWLALLTPIPAAAQSPGDKNAAQPRVVTSSGVCEPTKSKFVTATGAPSSTVSLSFVNVSNTTISFVVGGASASCVIVSFSAEAFTDANNTMLVRVLLDAATDCQPVGVYFATSNTTFTGYAARAMNFVCKNVAPGSHKIKMQYQSLSGGAVYLDYRTTIVQYKK